jgi:hypothetical protein
MKGKKETIGIIKSNDLLRKTRGMQRACFRTGTYQTQKNRPRNKNWQSWIEDDICWCGDSDECEYTDCYRHTSNMSGAGIYTMSCLMNTEYCPLKKGEYDGR